MRQAAEITVVNDRGILQKLYLVRGLVRLPEQGEDVVRADFPSIHDTTGATVVVSGEHYVIGDLRLSPAGAEHAFAAVLSRLNEQARAAGLRIG